MNQENTKVMIISKDKKIKNDFNINVNNKEIKHSPVVKILGYKVNEELNWDSMLLKGNDSLICQLKTRLRTISKIGNFLDTKMVKQYVNAIFRGKMLFGMEIWGGSALGTIDKLDKLQSNAARLALGKDWSNKTDAQRLKHLKWLPIRDEINYVTHKMTHKILNIAKPEEISSLMPMATRDSRIRDQRKLDTKPKILNNTDKLRKSFRSRAYAYNMLPGPHKRLRPFMYNHISLVRIRYCRFLLNILY